MVREATNLPYTGVVAVRQEAAWLLEYLDGRPAEQILDSDESENRALVYGMYYKLRI